MNNDETAGDLAAIIFNALFTDHPVTFEHVLPGQFVYVTLLDNGFAVSAYFNAVAGEYIASYNNGIDNDSTEFLAESVFRTLASRHARQNLPAEVYEALYL